MVVGIAQDPTGPGLAGLASILRPARGIYPAVVHGPHVAGNILGNLVRIVQGVRGPLQFRQWGKGRSRAWRLRRTVRSWSARSAPARVYRRQGSVAARADDGGAPSPVQAEAIPPGEIQSCCVKLCARSRMISRVVQGSQQAFFQFPDLGQRPAQASGASSNTSRVKVTRSICV